MTNYQFQSAKWTIKFKSLGCEGVSTDRRLELFPVTAEVSTCLNATLSAFVRPSIRPSDKIDLQVKHTPLSPRKRSLSSIADTATAIESWRERY